MILHLELNTVISLHHLHMCLCDVSPDAQQQALPHSLVWNLVVAPHLKLNYYNQN